MADYKLVRLLSELIKIHMVLRKIGCRFTGNLLLYHKQ